MVNEKSEETTIQLSKKLKEKLASLGKKKDTYEDIIWNLIEKK